SATAGLWAVIALNVTPIFNIGAFLMTIDALSVFFWLAAMFTFWLALEKSPHFSWHWPLTGLLIGFGFLSKYTNAFELVSILAVLALAPRLRREFARPGLYFLLGMFALCTVPPITWNAHHAWITLTHLRSRGGIEQGFGFHPFEVLSFVGAHFLAYSPFLFLALAWGVIGSWRRVNQQFKVLFLMWFGLPDGKVRPARLKRCATISKGNWERNCFSLPMLAIALRKFHFICATNDWRVRVIRPFTSPNRRTW